LESVRKSRYITTRHRHYIHTQCEVLCLCEEINWILYESYAVTPTFNYQEGERHLPSMTFEHSSVTSWHNSTWPLLEHNLPMSVVSLHRTTKGDQCHLSKRSLPEPNSFFLITLIHSFSPLSVFSNSRTSSVASDH